MDDRVDRRILLITQIIRSKERKIPESDSDILLYEERTCAPHPNNLFVDFEQRRGHRQRE